MDEGEPSPLRRRRDRARHLAIPQLWCLARAPRDIDALFRLSARDARSLVQSHLSAQTSEKTSLLARADRVLRDAAAVLFTSEEGRQLARESFALYRCNEVVVNYGTAQPQIDLTNAREDFLSAFPTLRGKRILLFLGRLHEKKGCDLLLEAFRVQSKSKMMHFVMAGPTAHEDYLERLQSLAAELPVTFCGMLRANLKWGAFAAAQVFILPSHQENFGIAVVEALACGLPVLISDRVKIWREIDVSGAGYVESDTLAGTSRLLERWFAAPTSSGRLCARRRSVVSWSDLRFSARPIRYSKRCVSRRPDCSRFHTMSDALQSATRRKTKTS